VVFSLAGLSGLAQLDIIDESIQMRPSHSPRKSKVLAQIPKMRSQNVARLQRWIALPSIAAESPTSSEGARHLVDLVLQAGFDEAIVMPTAGKPGVFATLDAGASKTLGIYFRYDVVPFRPDEWSVPPLEGRLVQMEDLGVVCVGRGTFDQQGPQNSFLSALMAFRAAKVKLPVNLILVGEGEEEIGSPHLNALVTEPRVSSHLKACLGVVLPEASQTLDGSVDIALGAKGIVDIELVASAEGWGRGPRLEVHSSRAAHLDNPAWHLIQALNTLIRADGHTPAMEGFGDHVKALSPAERQMVYEYASGTSESDAKRQLGAERWVHDLSWCESLVRLFSEPTLNLQGLSAGYTGPGGMAILPHKAVAKIDIRLVPDMTAALTFARVKTHLMEHGFGDIQVNMNAAYDPSQTNMNSGLIKSMQEAYCTLGTSTRVLPRNPGSWPACVFSRPPLNLPVATFGLGYGSGAHGPDEYYLIESVDSRLHGLDGAVASFVEFLYALA
jgi:acetylornithine deacetylase/succinyl-diaminopimelate desuccinylase-like protein